MFRTVIPSLCLLALLAACGEKTPSYPQRQPPAGFLENASSRAVGKALFREHCASCHGTIEEGRRPASFRPPASDFSAPKYRTIDPAYLFWRISKGKAVEPYLSQGSVMPSWEPHFAEEEIWQLVAYLRSRPGGG